MLVSVLPVEKGHLEQFNHMIAAGQIPSKERMVFVESPSSKNIEEEIRELFHGKKNILMVTVFILS